MIMDEQGLQINDYYNNVYDALNTRKDYESLENILDSVLVFDHNR